MVNLIKTSTCRKVSSNVSQSYFTYKFWVFFNAHFEWQVTQCANPRKLFNDWYWPYLFLKDSWAHVFKSVDHILIVPELFGDLESVVVHGCHGAEPHTQTHVFMVKSRICEHTDNHLGKALTVTDILNLLLSCNWDDILPKCGLIVQAMLMKTEVPIVFRLLL